MKTFIEKNKKSSKNWRIGFSTFVFLTICSLPIMAETQEEIDAMKREADFQNMISYILMVVTFLVVIAIAWFGAMKKKKGDGSADGHNHPVNHHHHAHHSPHDKRYGTHHR